MREDFDEKPVEGPGETPPSTSNFNHYITILKDKLRNKTYRRKLAISLCIGYGLITIGLMNCLRGLAFLDIQLITGTQVEDASKFFIMSSLGFMTGAFFVGPVGRKFNADLLIACGGIVTGALAISIPYCTSYASMMTIVFLQGFFSVCPEIVGNMELMRLWAGEDNAVVHIVHLGYSLGWIVGPYITEPFLSKRRVVHHNGTLPAMVNLTLGQSETPGFESSHLTGIAYSQPNNQSWTAPSHMHSGYNTSLGDVQKFVNESGISQNETSITGISLGGTTQIHYAYLIAGSLQLIHTLMFFSIYFYKRRVKFDCVAHLKVKDVSSTSTEIARKVPKVVKFLLVGGICTFAASYNGVMNIFPSFLMSFMVNQFEDVTKSQVAFITANMGATQLTANVVGIILSAFIRPVKLLIFSATVIITCVTGVTSGALTGNVLMISVFSTVLGFGFAAFSPIMTWCESELVLMRNVVSSAVFFSGSMGIFLSPLFLGVLMERLSNMWFCYLFQIEAIVLVIVFPSLLAFNRLYVDKKYGPLRPRKSNALSTITNGVNGCKEDHHGNGTSEELAEMKV